MSKEICYGQLCFEPNLVFAVTTDLTKIKFSKYERALLEAFFERPGQLLSRSQLLDKVLEDNTDTLDRSIDYLISRLRRKLGDTASAPIYIETQYGEGYIWIAKQQLAAPIESPNIYLSIGQIFGRERATSYGLDIDNFIDALVRELQKNFGPSRPIKRITAEDKEDRHRLFEHQNARYVLEVSFISLKEKLSYSLVIMSRMTGQIFETLRYSVNTENKTISLKPSPSQLSKIIRDKIWDAQIFRATERRSSEDEPLIIGLYKASNLYEPNVENLKEMENKLRARINETPEDYRAAIMLVANLHANLLTGSVENIEDYQQEVEGLLFQHLDKIQNDALYLTYAADRLYNVGHRELGESLAERALDIGPSYAASYMTIGWIKITQGIFEEGLSYLDHSLDMTEADSPFFKYLQTLKCIAYKAIGDMVNVREIAHYLIKNEPNPIEQSNLHFYFLSDDPKAVSNSGLNLLESLPKEYASKSLEIAYFAIAKSFINEVHRKNILSGAISAFMQTHGITVVPDIIQNSVPTLFQNLVTDSNSV